MKRAYIALLSCLLLLGLCLDVGTEANAASVLFLTREESERLFADISQVPFTASSGAGAWEGELSVHQDGSFTGHYSDADDDGIYEVTFSGRFGSVEVHGYAYWLWVEEMTTLQTPGTRGVDEYGETVFYTEPPFAAWDYMVLTLPGTPDSEIPEMVQGEIGGTLDEWVDFSRFYTLTRRSDGWGFFAEKDGQIDWPDSDEGNVPLVQWCGIWQARQSDSRLYIFREEGGPGDYQVIHVMEKNGETRAIRGSLYFLDEITVDYDVPGIVHGAIVGDPYGGILSLTPFSAVDERMMPWMPVIEDEYAFVQSLDDPVGQINPSIWNLAEIGLGPIAAPTPTAAPNTSYQLPKNVSRLPNGNLRYDDGLIAFEMPEDGFTWIFRGTTGGPDSGSRYPENTTVRSVHVGLPSPDEFYDFMWTETQTAYDNVVTVGVAQFPADVDAIEFVWADWAGRNNTGYMTIAGRTAKYYSVKDVYTEVSVPLSGNRVFGFSYFRHSDALDLFLSTLEIRDSLYAEPPTASVQTMKPAPTPAPIEAPAASDLSAWTGYWMTRDDSLAELIVTDNGNGTLHAQALFLPAGNCEATLTPQADGSMRFEDKYGSLKGLIQRRLDGALYLTITGGSTMEDEEATEYQGYYARGFAYYPAAYEEMWYQAPEEAAATEDDWLGAWTMLGGAGDSTLRIIEQSGDLRVEVTLGQYHFSGLGELAGDDALDLYTDDFSCMLLLNKKLNRIAMMEVGSDIEAVYDWAGNGYYGVALYQRDDHHIDGPDSLQVDDLPPVLIMPVPTAPGATQIIVDLPTPAPTAAPEDDLSAEPWVGAWVAHSESHTARMDITPGDMCDYFVRFTFDGQYTLTGQLAINDDDTLNVYADDYIGQFGAILTMNEGLNAAVMDDVSCEVAEINAWLELFRFQLTFVRQGAQPAATDAPAQTGATLLPVPGKTGVMQAAVSYADATSWIVSSKDPYAFTPAKMVDGDETTAFQFSTKTTRLGQEYLTFAFGAPVTLDEMWMKNGFWKIADGKDQYTRNSRVKKMTIQVRYAGESGFQTLKTVSLKDDKARKDWKVIDMLHAENVTAVRIRVDEIHKGSKYPNDVCISEIMFVQYTVP